MIHRFVRFAALLAFSAATASAQNGQALVVRETAAPCLNIRTIADASSSSIACLTPGTAVTGIATAPYWRNVMLADGRKGWAAKKFLAAADSAATTAGGAASDTIPDNAWLEIHVVDVGQGDGIWIHTYDDGIPGNGRFEGKNIVIDGGPTSSDAKNPFLKYLQATSHAGAVIDALIITHPHVDHFPGALGVVKHFEVCDYYDSNFPATGSTYTSFLAAVQVAQCAGHATTMHMGRATFGTPNWGSELTVEFLYAYPGTSTGLGSGNDLVNNASVVMKLTYGTQSMLFMGDAEGKNRADPPDTPKYAEAIMLADAATKAKLKSTVLKVAHHGSETSSTLPFINAVDPSIVVVSSGRKSFSGTFLPDASTLQRYCTHNPAIRIYRTDQDDEAEGLSPPNDADGDHIVIRMNGKQTVVQALAGGKPFAPTACVP